MSMTALARILELSVSSGQPQDVVDPYLDRQRHNRSGRAFDQPRRIQAVGTNHDPFEDSSERLQIDLTPFAFLAEVERRFKTRFSPQDLEASTVSHLELQDAFEDELEALMHQYSTNPPNDPLKQAQSDLNNVYVP
ncbi:hypothetical protein QFC19_001167 [Naganishia cerealis]|uniref:Uncharacterized protein n=1 Tax=Naganishia cerealis TaxID=610337 RepID=A0ACC2WI02_9TREE|nr:hypothetical protein QFC19_001167 [Naganishia cerealis]